MIYSYEQYVEIIDWVNHCSKVNRKAERDSKFCEYDNPYDHRSWK